MLYIVLVAIACLIGLLWGLNLSVSLSLISFFILFLLCMLIRNNSLLNKYKISTIFNSNYIFIMLAVILFFNLYSRYRLSSFKTKYNDNTVYSKGKLIKYESSTLNYNKYLYENDFKDKFYIFIPNELNVEEYSIIEINDGRYEKPLTSMNFSSFNYDKYLYSQGIYGSIYLEKNNFYVLGINKTIVEKLRSSIKSQMRKNVFKRKTRHYLWNGFRRSFKRNKRDI